MNGEVGKEVTPVTGRTKPEMVTINGKQLVPGGRWNSEAMAKYILENDTGHWITIGQLARIGCGANTIPNKKRVRQRLSQLFMLFLRQHEAFLAIDYGGDHNGAMGVKIADLTLAEDRQNVEAKLERMRKRSEMNETTYQQTTQLLHRMIAKVTHKDDLG
jgi:hypothetical protein